MTKIAILGAGLRGLYLAYQLQKKGYSPTIFESSYSVGGSIKSISHNEGYLTEDGAHTLLVNNKEIENFLKEFPNLDKNILIAKKSLNRFVLKNGELNKIKPSPKSILCSPLLGINCKLKILSELFRKKKKLPHDISLYDFFKLHFGKDFSDYIIDPFINGSYAGDPKKLIAKYIFPGITNVSEESGSIIRYFLFNNNSFKSYIVSFKNGLLELPLAIQEKLEKKPKLGTEILFVKKLNSGWNIKYKTKSNKEQENDYDVIFCTIPAFQMPKINCPSSLKKDLPDFGQITHPSVSVLSLGFHNDQILKPLSGFGYLIPKILSENHLGVLFSSNIFSNRSPNDHSLITVFSGGTNNKAMTNLSKDALTRALLPKLKKYLSIIGEPKFTYLRKWENSIPQYSDNYGGFLNQVKTFEDKHNGFFLCGNYKNGVSLGSCFNREILQDF